MKEKQVYKNLATSGEKFQKIFLWHQSVHTMYLNVDRQGCVIKTVAYSLRTNRHTDRHTDTQAHGQTKV